MSFSNYLETQVLGHVFGSTTLTKPTKYVALFTAAPGEAGGGTEVSGAGYARVTANFNVSGNQAANSAVIEFPTAESNWGEITHVGIFDAPTGGNLLAYAELVASRIILTGDIARFPTSNLVITLE